MSFLIESRILRQAMMSLIALFASQLCVSAKNNERDEVYAFLAEKLCGKTLMTKTTAIIGKGQVETEFSRRRTFNNLHKTEHGLAVDCTSIISQEDFDLDESGNRIDKPPEVRNRVVVTRYEVQPRRSTGELIGLARTMINSSRASTGKANALRLSLTDGTKLTFDMSSILYSDLVAKEGKRKPGVQKIRYEYWIDNDQLRCKIEEVSVRVDPETLEPSGEPRVITAEESEEL